MSGERRTLTPAHRPDIKARIHALAERVLGERADRHLLLPVLVTALSVEVNDFVRHHDPALAKTRVRDHQILLRQPWARRKGAR
jgi:hypothetical protein